MHDKTPFLIFDFYNCTVYHTISIKHDTPERTDNYATAFIIVICQFFPSFFFFPSTAMCFPAITYPIEGYSSSCSIFCITEGWATAAPVLAIKGNSTYFCFSRTVFFYSSGLFDYKSFLFLPEICSLQDTAICLTVSLVWLLPLAT